VFVALASIVVSGLLPSAGFFRALTLGHPLRSSARDNALIGTSAIAPAILALSYANYSNRGVLLYAPKGSSASS